VIDLLQSLTHQLAAIDAASVEACARALGCSLQPDARRPQQHWGSGLSEGIESIDVRIGDRGGVVVVRLAQTADRERAAAWAEGLGPPVNMHIVSPPIHTPCGGRPPWDRAWSVTHTIDGQPLHFSLEQHGQRRLLVSISHTFDAP